MPYSWSVDASCSLSFSCPEAGLLLEWSGACLVGQQTSFSAAAVGVEVALAYLSFLLSPKNSKNVIFILLHIFNIEMNY
jgi:hypothetical protein